MKLGFFTTLLGVLNSFIVMTVGMNFLYTAGIARQNYILGSLLLLLGLLGIVLTFTYRFRERKAIQPKATTANPRRRK